MAISGSKLGSLAGSGAGYAIGAGIGSVGGPLGMMIGSALGGMLGSLFDEGPDVQAIIAEMAKQYEGIVPPDLAKAIVYAQYKQGGELTPQQLSELPIEAQSAVQLRESPEFKQKQQVQLQQMEQLAQTGMGPQEILALEQSRRAAASDAQARFKSILQQYQQMGQAGGGASLAASLQAAQSADDREAMTNMQAAAMAAENRRNAIQQAFSAASGMRQQDLQVNQYNTENLRQKQMFDIQNALTRQQQNAQYANQANMYNLQRQQQVADMNLQQLNQELYRQQYLAPQQMFQNQMALANARAGIIGMKANLQQQQAQMQAQSDMNFMTGLTQVGMGAMQMQQNQQMMSMYAGKEGLVKNAAGEWVKNMAPTAVSVASSQLSPTAQAYNALPDYVPPAASASRGLYQAPAVNMGPSSYAYPGMGPQASYMPNDPFEAAMQAQMGVGGNQAGMGYRPFDEAHLYGVPAKRYR